MVIAAEVHSGIPYKRLSYEVVYENDEVIFHCNSSLKPHWYKDGEPLHQDKVIFLSRYKSLFIYSAKQGDSGLYSCVGFYDDTDEENNIKMESIAIQLYVAGICSSFSTVCCKFAKGDVLYYSESQRPGTSKCVGIRQRS